MLDSWYDLSWNPFMGFFPPVSDLRKPRVIVCFDDPWLQGGVCAPEALFNLARVMFHHTFIVFTDNAAGMQQWVDNYYKHYRPTPVQVSPSETVTPQAPFRNLCLGVKVFDQDRAGGRIYALGHTQAAMRALAYHVLKPLDLHNLPVPLGNLDAIKANILDFVLIYGHQHVRTELNWFSKALMQLGHNTDRYGEKIPNYKYPPIFVQNLGGNMWDEKGRQFPCVPTDPSTWPLWCNARDRLDVRQLQASKLEII